MALIAIATIICCLWSNWLVIKVSEANKDKNWYETFHFYGISSCILLFLITITLVWSNILLVKLLNKTNI